MYKTLVAIAALAVASFCPAVHAENPVTVGWDQQLFPSFLIATASMKPPAESDDSEDVLGDRQGLLSVHVTASEDDQPIRIIVRCDEFMEPSEFDGVLPFTGESYEVKPKIRYRFDKLSKCHQATPATITIEVQTDGKANQTYTATVVFRSINDCPLKIVQGETVIDTKLAMAAYVNEQHPFVDKLLREALDLGVVDRFTGYQSKDRGEVIRQVYALWDLMVQRDVRYSSITTTAATSQQVLSQHVRLVEDTANNSQANCLDGSVLFVSMLRKIGINASLVLQPGHCYVLFSTDPQNEQIYGLETTLVDTVVEAQEEIPELFDNAVAEDLRDEQSWSSFLESIGVGTYNLSTNSAKFRDESEIDFEIIDIAKARNSGLLPIPFDSKEIFVSFDHSQDDEAASDESQESDEDSWSEDSDSDTDTVDNSDADSDEDEDNDEDDDEDESSDDDDQ